MLDRDTVKGITLGFGIIYAIVGILGFIPGIATSAPNVSGMNDMLLFGIFGVNTLHNISHILFGLILIWGGATTLTNAVWANRVLALVFLILLIANFIPGLSDLFMLNGPDFFLHLLSLIITGFLGYVAVRDLNTPAERV
ncbi:MAG TPA: DUF4383 domain-containing protein [Chloroflexia bacterium]|nr:DUF4383 domain-containing protein [Chloroflexia bacterium]